MSRAKLGQVFLKNPFIVQEIIKALDPQNEETIIEIGPGKGVLTEALAGYDCKLIAVEVDKYLYEKLLSKFKKKLNIEFINSDILKINVPDIIKKINPDKIKIAGNIPYYITSPILNFLVDNKNFYKTALLMVQKEVGERILAAPHSRKYGALTLFIQYNMKREKIIDVPREDFAPPPEVDSMVIRLSPLLLPGIKVEDESLFFKIIHASFQKRRKMIHNALSHLKSWGKDIDVKLVLEKAGINYSARAEDLSIEDYARLCAVILDKKIN
ncbi:ribosomal RNA small subunit methyltransferase A [Candidatus Desantisbacteria bacterium]|nr:ribosomal RNA small subunit methyltransferase A [Candidatus Desantisbacteria bacterium]